MKMWERFAVGNIIMLFGWKGWMDGWMDGCCPQGVIITGENFHPSKTKDFFIMLRLWQNMKY